MKAQGIKKYRKRLIWLAIILLFVCLVPIPRRVNVKLSGVSCDIGDSGSLKNCELVIKGWAKWYLIRPDSFKGEFYLQDEKGYQLGGAEAKAELIKCGDSVFFRPKFIIGGYGKTLDVFKMIWCFSKKWDEAVVYDDYMPGDDPEQHVTSVFAAPATTYQESQSAVQRAVLSTGFELEDWWRAIFLT